MSKVLVLLANGFEEIEALSVVDVLRRANIEVVMAAIDKKQVTGAHNVKVQADMHILDVKNSDFDMVVLPGGLPGATNLEKDENVQKLLKDFDHDNKAIGAICAAPIALQRAGVLKKTYTCYPSFENNIRQEGYLSDQDVVNDENVTTSRGPATAMKFGLALVEKLAGPDVALDVKNQLLL
ncbi:DJ-1 family glyoxalase III [Sulfurospirillum sp. 1612]|uniref:DJ-1 family glyoxalase III n=1 Tax=Sulfurospirillum sp. 1612 TaxID=3094835 RepID=UPI002F955D55